jgi:hypothetical protein
MSTFVYPTSAELKGVEPDLLPVLTQDDPVFDIFPMETADAELLIWEKMDNWRGLMQYRGINGSPPLVSPPGQRQFFQTPSYYGEVSAIDEQELTRRRQFATWNVPIDVTDLVRQRHDFLLTRQIARVKKICWDLLTTGVVNVYDAKGTLAETYSYTQRVYNPTVLWSTPGSSTPLLDFRNVQLLQVGYSLDLGAGAMAFMNRITFNNLIQNTNNADIYGRRTEGLGTFNSLDQINTLWMKDDLPQIKIYEDGYIDEATGTFTRYLPTGYVVVVGKRPMRMALGAFRMTRNANNMDLSPGAYVKVIDRGEMQVPRTIEVHRGFNGGPILYYPSGVIVMKVM